MKKLLICCITLICTSICDAKSWAPQDPIVPDSIILKEVEVSSNPTQKSLTSSSPWHNLNHEKLITNGSTDIADAIHRLPGITLRDYGGAGGMKTVSVRGFGATHTAVIYDGVTLSNVQSGTIDVSRYSIDNIDGLTLTIGDNDDIFLPVRSVSSSASLSIQTFQPTEKPQLCAQVRTGSWGFVNPYLRTNIPIYKNTNIGIVGEYTHADNNYPFTLKNINLITTERRINSKMNSGHAEINLMHKTSNNGQLSSKIYFYDNQRQLPGPVIYYNNVCKEKLHERNFFWQVLYRNSINEKLSLLTIAKFNYSSSFYHDEHGRYPSGILDNRYWQREWYCTASLLFRPSNSWVFDYSFDYIFNNFNSNLAQSQLPLRHSILQSLTGKWSIPGITVTGRLIGSIFINKNLNGESAKDARKLSPSISASIQPWSEQNLFFRASYKNIFRLPTFNESYYDNYGSKDLKPENTDQINIGVTYSPRLTSDIFSANLTLDGYINHIKDMIVAVPYNMFVWYMTNLDKVRTVGVDFTSEFNTVFNTSQSLIFALNYSFQRAEPRTSPTSSEWGKQVAYIPKHSGAASLCWKNPWLDVTIHGSGVSDRFTTNNNLPQTRIRGYIEAGISGRRAFRINKHRLTCELQILNIFNKQYEIVANYPMPGRSWRAMLRYDL